MTFLFSVFLISNQHLLGLVEFYEKLFDINYFIGKGFGVIDILESGYGFYYSQFGYIGLFGFFGILVYYLFKLRLNNYVNLFLFGSMIGILIINNFHYYHLSIKGFGIFWVLVGNINFLYKREKFLHKDQLFLNNIKFNCLSKKVFFHEKTFNHYITVNSEILIKLINNKELKAVYEKSKTTVDSSLIYNYLKLKYPRVKLEKLSGSDLIIDIIKQAKKNNRKIFLYGGTKESNQKCVSIMRNTYSVETLGLSQYFNGKVLSQTDEKIFINQLSKVKPYYFIVGLGCPKQEFFINKYKNLLIKNNVITAIGIGGALDFISGYEKRAPVFIRNIMLEWLYRLIQNPKKNIKNYKFFIYFQNFYKRLF